MLPDYVMEDLRFIRHAMYEPALRWMRLTCDRISEPAQISVDDTRPETAAPANCQEDDSLSSEPPSGLYTSPMLTDTTYSSDCRSSSLSSHSSDRCYSSPSSTEQQIPSSHTDSTIMLPVPRAKRARSLAIHEEKLAIQFEDCRMAK